MIQLFAPLVIVVALGTLVAFVNRGLSPHHAARVALLVLVLGGVTTVPVIGHLVISFVVGIPEVGPLVHNALHRGGVHLAKPNWLGPVALVAFAYAVFLLTRLFLSRRKLRVWQGGGVVVAPDTDMYAFALPGSQQGVVVSQGLIDSLTPDELAIVLAHEHAHLENRHDRWILVGQICAAVNPLMRHSLASLRFALERWADEDAVQKCGSRQLVRETIVKVALGSQQPKHALGVASFGVVERVRVLGSPERGGSRVNLMFSACGVMLMAVLCAFQWHHIAMAIAAVCG
jgi:hypothetical protein